MFSASFRLYPCHGFFDQIVCFCFVDFFGLGKPFWRHKGIIPKEHRRQNDTKWNLKALKIGDHLLRGFFQQPHLTIIYNLERLGLLLPKHEKPLHQHTLTLSLALPKKRNTKQPCLPAHPLLSSSVQLKKQNQIQVDKHPPGLFGFYVAPFFSICRFYILEQVR